jgi:hypothetical protein
MLPSTTRRLDAVLVIVAFVGVLVGTLTPSPGVTSSLDFWCLACGELAALDVVANMVLFMPLGFALAAAMNRRWLPLAICVATTVMVEALQVRIIVGRDASFRDILANSVGGIIGVELALRRGRLLWPTRTAATRLALGWSAAFAGMCAATTWGLRPAFVPRSLWMQWLPPRTGYEPFTGRLLAFDIDGIDLPLGYPSPSLGLDKRLMADIWRATATIDRDGLTPRRSVIVRISEEFTQPFALEQLNWDLTCLQKTRSAELRFRSPRIALRDAFRLSSGTYPDIVRLRCLHRHGGLVASVEAGSESREEVVLLSPSLGWTLLSPFDIPIDSRTWWIGALWVMALVFPIGYWWSSAMHRAARSSGLRTSMVIGAGVLAGATYGFVIAPLVAGTADGAWWEWCAVVAGIACGALFRHLLLATLAFRLRT